MNDDPLYFYGNSITIKDESEIEDAKTYLILWKRFFERTLPKGASIPDGPRYSEIFYRPMDNFVGLKLAVKYSGDEQLPKRYSIYRNGLTDED